MGVIIRENMSIHQKLEVLSDAAKYDVACTSSGVDRQGDGSGIGNSVKHGICHSFSDDGRCISLLKILFTNECIFDCKYCLNRSSNDVVRTSFTPEEVCDLTIEFYKRNYIEGLFLSSGVLRSPNYTMEKICTTLRLLREVYKFQGYIHCKAVPGADASLIEMTGWYADRMSVNMELPTASGLKELAPHKTRNTILRPMKQIQLGRQIQREYRGYEKQIEYGRFQGSSYDSLYGSSSSNDMTIRNGISITKTSVYPSSMDKPDSLVCESGVEYKKSGIHIDDKQGIILPDSIGLNQSFGLVKPPKLERQFVPGGQSTQFIVGASGENDLEIMSVSEALYGKYDLKRVFYSAYVPLNEDSMLPSLDSKTPLLREHRLYQADFLLRFYGFTTSELLTKERPNFNILMDPKCNWAVGNLHIFPVEVNRADYYTLLRVPGIGTTSAKRIINARKNCKLDFNDLRKMGIVLKRAMYFITCNGRMMYQIKMEENFITNQLIQTKERLPAGITDGITYRQLSLFDDINFNSNEKDVILQNHG